MLAGRSRAAPPAPAPAAEPEQEAPLIPAAKAPLAAAAASVAPLAMPAFTGPPEHAAVRPQALVGGNFPISNLVDPITSAIDVDRPASAYDPVNARYLTVW